MKLLAVAVAMVGSSLLLLPLVVPNGSFLSPTSSDVFWGKKISTGGIVWAVHNSYVFAALLLILAFQVATNGASFWLRFYSSKSRSSASSPSDPMVSSSLFPKSPVPDISDVELKILMDDLDEKHYDNLKWEHVIDKGNNQLSYSAKCYKPKDGPHKYLSVTVFEDCSVELLRDFYMDNDYRKSWDQTIVGHQQLRVDENSGIEIGRTIKKFPFLTPREYVLAWRLWEGNDRTFYCFCKDCEHHSVPRQKKYVRVSLYRSGWRIKKVHARNACEIKMVYQEDSGLNVGMAKLAFSKGIWSYVCKMNGALRKYPSRNQPPSSRVNAITLIQKVPPELDARYDVNDEICPETSTRIAVRDSVTQGCKGKLSRRPSNKLIANGLILVGGIICLSRSHSNLGAKIAMAYILSKLANRNASSRQCG